ncbi:MULTISPECIES: beta-ketothiolase BktB [unclassified Mesorhizobium]|uniref:beta-ketothiolase BktB n=1 Tax=unclassified Mesorhizobium TaxID=325217 RepID=UPI0011272FE7|nr:MULTISPECIES: beta-ketothiolase BktB [unclassified Mesorhizobium]TPL00755.1 acetyl-CoA C-acyltransferase [Mesorhizobium sp. B2-4-16]TPL76984.1 acetyl-CoA C-acyltransferase [Mesorhizobium sp. B2-4-3]
MTNSVVITGAVRTAIGDFGGSLASLSPCDLGTLVATEALRRGSLEPSDVGQAVFGHVIHTAPEDMYLSRVVSQRAGCPESTPAITLNRLCGSGLQAVVSGSEQIALGNCGTALVGGVEVMSRAGHLLTQARRGQKMGDVTAIDMMVGALTDPFGNGHMGVTAENIARNQGIGRKEQDSFALESHRRAAQAIADGRFKDQILPIQVKRGSKTTEFSTDEHVRPALTLQDLAQLRPVFLKHGTVTAGNASGINDGAAALVLEREDHAVSRGVNILARIVASGLGGVDPSVMGLGPIPAVRSALERGGISTDQLDVIESNEAFAVQACAVSRELGFADERVNPNGGAVALGHPVGASGAMILVKLLYELVRTNGRYGLATMCIGGGQGIAIVVERA